MFFGGEKKERNAKRKRGSLERLPQLEGKGEKKTLCACS